MNNNISIEAINEIVNELNSISAKINNEIETINGHCSEVFEACMNLKSYNAMMVANSKKTVTLEEGNNQSSIIDTWEEWKISNCDDAISLTKNIQKFTNEIKNILPSINELLANIQNSSDTMSREQALIESGLIDKITTDEYRADAGDWSGIKDENVKYWTDGDLYFEKDPNNLGTNAWLVYQIDENGNKVGMGWTDETSKDAYLNALNSNNYNNNSFLDTLKDGIEKGIDMLKQGVVAMSGISASTLDKLNISNDSNNNSKSINLTNIDENSAVGKATIMYADELSNAKYSVVEDNIYATVVEETINGQPVLVTHVVVNDGNQVGSHVANGAFGKGGQTLSEMVADVKESGKTPVVAVFGSHYTSGGYQDQNGNASNTNGVIISGGEIIKDGVTKGNELQLFSDGTINTSTGQTAQELVDSGVKDTFTCHSVPAIIDGSTARSYEETNLYKRQVLGSTNTGEYYIVTDLTNGNKLSDTAEYLKSKGCVEAQSFDQGGSVEIIFNGTIINDISNNIGDEGTNENGERYGADMFYISS